MNNIVSNIKILFALIACLFFFTVCVSGNISSSDVATNKASSVVSDGKAVIASILGLTPISESTLTSDLTPSFDSTSIPRLAPGSTSTTNLDLASDTIYHYRIISEDANGNSVVSEDRIFKTDTASTTTSTITDTASTTTSTTTDTASTTTSTTTVPEGATVITGLKTGATLEIAINNTNVLNAALDGGNKNLVIPAGEWYTNKRVTVMQNTTLTFKGKLHQINDSSSDKTLLNIAQGNVILNNPQLSQKGIVGGHGTHTCLAIYGSNNTGDITVNGGIIEWGASNNFQGGRNNTVFNGTIFRDSVEHLVYANGISGDGTGNGEADGLIFNDCIFERPGNGLYDSLEANHIQLRNYRNVEFNNCIVQGKKKTSPGQYGLLATNVDGLIVNDTIFNDYSAGLLYTGDGTKGVVFNRVTASGDGLKHIRRSSGAGDATFNDCTFNRPYGIEGDTRFNNSTFKPTSYYMASRTGSTVTFESCTWDYSNFTYSKAFVKETGSSVTFTGTQTKIAPSDGHSLDWGILSTEG